MAERAVHVIVQVAEPAFGDIHRDRAGLDLGKIENVVDEREQVVAGRMDRLGEFDCLAVRLPSSLCAS